MCRSDCHSTDTGTEVEATKSHTLTVLALIEDFWLKKLSGKTKRTYLLDSHPIYAALETGNIELVLAFLSSGYRYVEDVVSTPMVTAAVPEDDEDEDDQQEGSDGKPLRLWRTSRGWTLLSRAVYLGHVRVVCALLEQNSNPLISAPPLLTRWKIPQTAATALFGFRSLSMSPPSAFSFFNRSPRIAPALEGEGRDPEEQLSRDLEDGIVVASSPTPPFPSLPRQSPLDTIPNAHNLALLRVHRQQLLLDSLQPEAVLSNRAQEKLQLSKVILSKLNETKAVKQRRNRWITSHTLKEAVFHAILVAFFTAVVVLANGSSPKKYKFNNIVSSKTTGNEFPMDPSAHTIKVFSDIGNTPDLWTFLNSVLMDNLFPGYGDGWLDEHNRLVGGIRLYQERANAVCTASVSGVWSDLGLYDPHNNNSSGSGSCFSYSANASYPYHLVLSSYNATATATQLSDLEASNWIDGGTSAVVVEYVVGNMRENLLQLARLRVLLPTTGDAFPSSDFIVLPSSSISPFSAIDISVGALLLLFVFLLMDEWYESYSNIFGYLTSGWNFFEVVILSLGLIWCIMIFVARDLGRQQIHSFHTSSADIDLKLLELWSVGWLYAQAEFLVSISLMGTFIRFIKYIQWFPYIGPDIMALVKTLFSVRVLTFTIFVMFFIISLGIGVYIRFGASAIEFSSFGNSMISLFSIFTGNSFFESMIGGGPEQLLIHDNASGSRTTGVLFYVITSFLVTLILANIFINVTGVVYEEAHENSLRDWSDSIDNEMVTNTWLTSRGFLGNDTFSKIVYLSQSWLRFILPSTSLKSVSFLRWFMALGTRKKSTDWSVAREVMRLEVALQGLLAMDQTSTTAGPPTTAPAGPLITAIRKRRSSVMNHISPLDEGDLSGSDGFSEEENLEHQRTVELLQGTSHLREALWVLHEEKRRRSAERKACHAEIQRIRDRLRAVGEDIFAEDEDQLLRSSSSAAESLAANSAEWWVQEKKSNQSHQILLLEDLQERVVEAWVKEQQQDGSSQQQK